MALGATRGDVLGAVLGETLRLALVGVAFGLALALVASRLVESLLYGVDAANPRVMVLAVLAMMAAATAAGYLPARRATRIDPSVALRWE